MKGAGMKCPCCIFPYFWISHHLAWPTEIIRALKLFLFPANSQQRSKPQWIYLKIKQEILKGNRKRSIDRQNKQIQIFKNINTESEYISMLTLFPHSNISHRCCYFSFGLSGLPRCVYFGLLLHVIKLKMCEKPKSPNKLKSGDYVDQLINLSLD